MTTHLTRFTLSIAAFAALTCAASADEVRFRYHASELGDPEALYERMAARAEAACEAHGRTGIWLKKASQACAADLLDDFVAGAASPSLTAVHEQSKGERFAALR
jgi:UrcA family protein